MMQSTATPHAKRMARDFFPTPFYHTDLAQAEELSAGLVADILAWRERERLHEIDVNPLMVLGEGEGVVAVDALVALSEG